MAKTSTRLLPRQPRPHEGQLSLLPVKKTTFTLPQDLYRKLKVESAKRDVQMSSIVTEAVRKFFSEENH